MYGGQNFHLPGKNRVKLLPMIRMIQSQNAAHAKKYFSQALAQPDYYISDVELPGFWQGRMAERLGLNRETGRAQFFALCENLHPVTMERLTPRTKEERTTGYDINFHCPKSVSVLHVLLEDDHILHCFRDSVTETMQLIEADSLTRVRKDGAKEDRHTGELVWAHFTHQTARPVEDGVPDPHLHAHCFTFNATWDEQEQRYKAGQFRDIKREMPYYQAHFHKVLADKLTDVGYAVRLTKKSFEIEGVPQKVIDLFSKRTDEIGRIANEKGIISAKELDRLGALTRGKKQKGMSMSELREEWKKQIHALGADAQGAGGQAIRHAPDRKPSDRTAQHCVDHALLHSFERASVMSEKGLLREAFRYGLGHRLASAQEIVQAFRNDSRIIKIKEKGRMVCTTKEVLSEEKRMVDLARKGQGQIAPLYNTAPELPLTGQQAAAVQHILTTPNRISIVRGAAGTGKTTLMRVAVPKIEEAGRKVFVFSPTGDTSRGVLREEGFKNANTVASLIADKSLQEQLKHQAIWVDEAGMLGTKDMTSLLEIAQKQDAQLILGGDTRQHSSVDRGDALRILNTVAGIRVAEVDQIYRQQNKAYKSAVEDLSKGDVRTAFEKLDNIGFIKTVDPLNPNETIVKDYVAAVKKGKNALVVSPTHAQGEAVTKEIRNSLREHGLLGKKEITADRLKAINLTEAQKKDYRNYHPDQIVNFRQNVKGFLRGSKWEVDSASDDQILVRREQEVKPLPTDKAKHFNLYEKDTIQIAGGDRVRITNGGFDMTKNRLENGQMLEVERVFKDGTIHLRNPISKSAYTLNSDHGHITHAHCVTSHASQGKNIDEVFIYQPSGTFPATDAKQFYVSVSRGKERAHIYTDDKKALLDAASQKGDRQSAMELVSRNRRKHRQREDLQPEMSKDQQPKNDKDYEREF